MTSSPATAVAAEPLAGVRFRLEELLARGAAAWPDALALADEGRRLTFAAAGREAERTAEALRRAGVERGAVVAAVARNSVDLALAFFAAWKLGAAVAPLNYRLEPHEIERQLELVRPALVVGDAGYQAAARPHQARRLPMRGGVDDPAAILFTSGTTGRPRPVVVGHRGVARNTLGIGDRLGLRLADRFLLATSLCHIGGIIRLANALWAGAGVVLRPRWDVEQFARDVEVERVTHTMLIGPMLSDLLETAGPLESLRGVYYGAGRTPAVLVRRLAERFPHIGWAQGWGQTEMTGGVTLLTPEDHQRGLGDEPELLDSVGRPLPGVRLVAGDRDEPAEIAVAAEGLMLGHLEGDEIVPPPLREEALPSGDIGWLDDRGYLYVAGRTDDVIKSGGLQVVPAEVESVLHQHPAVREAAVVGVDDPRLGQAVAAFLVAEPGTPLDVDELRSWLRDRLAGFKQPRRITVLPSLPRTAAGKVDRASLA